jgi:hypothetical protein
MLIFIAIVLGIVFLVSAVTTARAIWYARSDQYKIDQRLEAVSRR